MFNIVVEMAAAELTNPRIPVTLLSGFLGAGKTTLLSHILHNREGLRVGLIVNDFSEINIDAAMIQSGDAGLSRVEDKVVELSNGCICCSLREELLAEMIKLAKERRFDYLIIESTGISEPLQVAEVFTFADEATGERLDAFAYLDTCVTLVDALNFSDDFGSGETLRDRKTAAHEGDTRSVVDLLIDQVEFANVIVLNKTDLVPARTVGALEATLRALNPDACILRSEYSRVPLRSILHTRAFSLEKAQAAPGWLKELRGQHVPESVEYGISSFVFRARRPFHPARLHALVYQSAALEGVLRSKGFFWLGCDGGMDDCAMWAHTGRVFQFSTGRTWWANVPRAEWPQGAATDLIMKDWDFGGAEGGGGEADGRRQRRVGYGDRRQELVFIGRGMDRPGIETALHDALLSDAELEAGPEAWEGYEDPFDFFPYEGDDEEEEEGGCEDGGEEEEGAGHAHDHHAGCDHGDHGHSHGGHGHHAPSAARSSEHDAAGVRRIVRAVASGGGGRGVGVTMQVVLDR